MQFFLERIAKQLYDEHGENLYRHCLVFPGRRAGLFFMKYLSGFIKKPLWTPSIMTINELFRSLSNLLPAESEILLFELYKCYRQIKSETENFDEFYFWGDMLLNDFDEVDKYLVDSRKLFQNVYDLKMIDQQFGGLTDEQIQIVKRFWTNFNPQRLTGEKQKFIGIWSVLEDLYSLFRSNLLEKNIAYEGMIFRSVAEEQDFRSLKALKQETFHFIGFNALNECEKSVMKFLKESRRAKFYWDYDKRYIDREKLNSAGFFLRENLKIFGNDMPGDWSYTSNTSIKSAPAKYRIIDTSSDVAQVKLLPSLIEEIPGLFAGNAHETSVILADENLLIPVLTSLPESLGDINITMGYPVRQTSVYMLVKNLLVLQGNCRTKDDIVMFNYEDVVRILKNPLISGLLNESENGMIKDIISSGQAWIPSEMFSGIETLKTIFKKIESPGKISDYLGNVLYFVNTHNNKRTDKDKAARDMQNEFAYRVMLAVNRIGVIAGTNYISMSLDTWSKLFDKIIKLQSVPFSGEPLSGIQIMGVLETRALDFRNVIMLSVNEGILPAGFSSSFIPFSLREAFGLPSVNHRESVYAYHFSRLLHRAENVTFVYNSNSEGLKGGEMSRFLQQMIYDPLVEMDIRNLSFEIKSPVTLKEEINRTEETSQRLFSAFMSDGRKKLLSPSAINTWLNCRMKFYYRYVNDLKEPEKISNEIDPAMLGTLLHSAMKELYSGLVGKVVNSDSLSSIIDNRHLVEDLISRTIIDVYGKGTDSFVAINEMMVRQVLVDYIYRILDDDRSIAPFKILLVEKFIDFPVLLETDLGKVSLRVGGIIDRVDFKDGLTRIVDYKTGRIADTIGSLDMLFVDDRDKDLDGWLQTLLYCEGYLYSNPDSIVRPSVYKLRKYSRERESDKLRIKDGKAPDSILEDYVHIRYEFMELLKITLTKMFSIEEPFRMTRDIRGKCAYCPYRILCMR